MVLLDTSVWIDHLRRGDARVASLLEAGDVVCHPLVVGELACGSLRQRHEILELLSALPHARHTSHDQILAFIEKHRLFGQGIGLIDVHLLWAVKEGSHTLWTLDRGLRRSAERLGVRCA